MHNPVDIENIEEMRRGEGIEDVELRVGIRGLRSGNFVRLTLLTGNGSFETLMVRITSIKGSAFRGKLADRPTTAGLSKLKVGVPLAFTSAHIHSLAKSSLAKIALSKGRPIHG
ncbi:MAG: hypothetical protein HY040_21585 [Planctomycetes bacterium]|nr:hypothetical protein [Planctomycetota bacterium]